MSANLICFVNFKYELKVFIDFSLSKFLYFIKYNGSQAKITINFFFSRKKSWSINNIIFKFLKNTIKLQLLLDNEKIDFEIIKYHSHVLLDYLKTYCAKIVSFCVSEKESICLLD